MKWWQVLLFPFAILYDCVTRVRNYAFDVGWKSRTHFNSPKTIAVGNLSVGGTGKTPMIEYLIEWAMEAGLKVATLSRGYGRSTKGFREVGLNDSAETVGDEPLGFYLRFGKHVRVFVGEKRVAAVESIKKVAPEIDLVLLDDAFQHRAILADYYVLLTTAQRPFWMDHLLPVGRLRESGNGWRRADVCVITKSIKPIPIPTGLSIPIARTTLEYEQPVWVHGAYHKNSPVHLVAGLADNTVFFEAAKREYNVVQSHSFKDHHVYTLDELAELRREAQQAGAVVLTTFKDYVKLRNVQEWRELDWGYWPIRVRFWAGESELKVGLRGVYEGKD